MKKKSKILEDLPRPEVDKLAAFYLKPGEKVPEALPDTPETAKTESLFEDNSEAEKVASGNNVSSSLPETTAKSVSQSQEVKKSTTSKVPKLDASEAQKLQTSEVQNINSSEVQHIAPPEAPDSITSEVRKFDSYEVLTIRISTEHLEWLNGLELKIRKLRKSLNPRITKNSIIRALLEAAQDIDIDFSEISDEDDLSKRIYEVMKLRSSKLQNS